MKKIVIPYDFSPESVNALNSGVKLAKLIDASILVLHVLEVPSSYLSLDVSYGGFDYLDRIYSEDVSTIVKDKLRAVESAVKEEGIPVATEIKYGRPYESIQKTIAEQDADMIIMGSKGASGLKEIFVGSNTERVIRFAKVPVLTVKTNVDFENMKEMVFATDCKANKAINLAKYIQHLLGLHVKLLKVYDSKDWVYTEGSALEKLEAFAEGNDFHDYSLHVIDSPFVTDGILEFAEENKADLIVMGTHGYTGIGHIIAGSNAEDVANHSKIPIFTTRM